MTANSPMRVSFLWSEPTGYLAACLIELAEAKGWRVQLLSRAVDPGSAALFERLDAVAEWRRLEDAVFGDAAAVLGHVTGFGPDAAVISGWFNPAFRRVAHHPALDRVGRVMTMDTPWRGTLRQRLGRFVIGRYLGRMHAVAPSGERARRSALNFGVPPARIRLYFCGYDARGFAAGRTASGTRPPGFLYVGRYAPEKGLATLAEAYRRYREGVDDPWPLHLCGRGPDDGGLIGAPGVTDHGFVAPDRLPEVMRGTGCFVFPSLYEPFGVALVEACGAGMPVIASSEVGAAVECLRDHANGFVFPAGDAAALAARLGWIHHAGADRLAAMGRIGEGMAAPFAERLWAERFDEILRDAAREAGRPGA